ncbi:YTH domain-containing protein ECT4 isoform X1 [Ziziphus jujuba]|uniref:YTH domain-containing family protein n=2 Tax=Ziziphus jujuba TaxID=326968 RepID=A0ABM3I619_ZIZJJ|nr:YTH domain-containing protein ECT4 isoform X1 [Ziziphus jujuba]
MRLFGGSLGIEMYNVPEHGNNETYMIQGMETNLHLTSPFEQVEAMYSEGTPEFVVDQGLYYPTATNYGYYCTGIESPSEWEDHRIFGVDGPDVQYAGTLNENLPYVYYTPTYGYTQSPYNPYNPYIPGAMIGVDGPFVGAQQYYSVPPYQNAVSSPAYIPVVVQPDSVPNSSPDSLFDAGTSFSRSDARGLKYNFNSASGAFPNSTKTASTQKNPLTTMTEGPRPTIGPSKQAATYGSLPSASFSSPASAYSLQGRNSSGSIPSADNLSDGKILSHHNQLKVALPGNNGLTEFGSSTHGRAAGGKLRPKIHVGRGLNDINSSPDALSEQNRGPRVNRSKNELAVKAYTTKAGHTNAQGNIIIHTDQYNKDDLPVEYADAKFFVIKSYSEDDVHKSIKYNVWSSTPHGNKKLNNAYEDAQRIAAGKPRGCPIFLFFSVNVSGQFCGVAEMTGPVDFSKDMDFWQQDKWSGSFPVKWHIIKDVSNASLRHIILENNENKPVTNSRDTQEVTYKKGLEMLKIFKNHTLKTSLLDDFMYYENRQKIMQEEKARLLVRSFESPYFVPAALGPPRKLNCVVELPPSEVENVSNLSDDPTSLKRTSVSSSEKVSSESNVTDTTIARNEIPEQIAVEAKDNVSTLKIGSLTIHSRQGDSKPSIAANIEPFDAVTAGSVPQKINGITESSGILTVGTIPLDPRALLVDKGAGGLLKNGSQQ